MLLLPAGTQPRQWPCQYWPKRIRNYTIKGQNCSLCRCDGGGECVAPSGASPSGGRGHWSQKSSSKELTPKFPRQGQMRENTQDYIFLDGFSEGSGTLLNRLNSEVAPTLTCVGPPSSIPEPALLGGKPQGDPIRTLTWVGV